MKQVLSPYGPKRPWETFPRPSALTESTVALSNEEAAWINKQSKRLMRSRRKEQARNRAKGLPLPPKPGNISYAVFM